MKFIEILLDYHFNCAMGDLQKIEKLIEDFEVEREVIDIMVENFDAEKQFDSIKRIVGECFDNVVERLQDTFAIKSSDCKHEIDPLGNISFFVMERKFDTYAEIIDYLSETILVKCLDENEGIEEC
jgi:DNA primase large subunit